MNKYKFYYGASSQICSSLDIEKALFNCLHFIRSYLPADVITLHLFNPGFGFVDTVAEASLDRGSLLSERTQLPASTRNLIQAFIKDLDGKPKCLAIERLRDDPLSSLVAEKLGMLDYPCLILDLIIENDYLGIITVSNFEKKIYTEEQADLILLLHNPLSLACANFLRYRELAELKDRLTENYHYLQEDMINETGDYVIGTELGLKGVMKLVRQVAHTMTPVLLLGETGVGKEVIARAVHKLSLRRGHPLIKVDCTAIPENLVESDLFGHEKGAFTGAVAKTRGRLERADGGTLFLDEIGELSLQTQTKLLRVLQERIIERVGGTEPIQLDIRIIAATNRPLLQMVEEGKFRKDLFFRLNVFPIEIPPLRQRSEDIPLLVSHIIKKESRRLGLPFITALMPGAIDILTSYQWPGNIRELKNVVEREMILCNGKPLAFSSLYPLKPEDVKTAVKDLQPGYMNLDQAMSAHIQKVLQMTNGRVEGPSGAARLMDIHPRTLQNRMKKLGIPFGRKYKKKRNIVKKKQKRYGPES